MALAFVSAAPAAHAAGFGREPSFAEIATTLQDAVVTVSTTSADEGDAQVLTPQSNKKKHPAPQPYDEFFQDFFDNTPEGMPQHITSVGSGFVIDPKGLVVTNNHVIEGGGDIYVNFDDGSQLKVDKIVGRDVKTDITLLKITPKEGKPLHSVSFGDSGKMRVGDWVMAIGNPFGLGGTVTVGILSATGRDINAGPYDEFLQTDAAINRGNSGGPLFNEKGEVIGVNTAIISPTGGNIGLGFAVPSNTVRRVVEQLRDFGEIRRGWIGIRIQSINDDIADSLGLSHPEGALVASVSAGGPAEKAGIAEGDVILSFGGSAVHSSRELPRLVAQCQVDREVDVEVMRAGERKNLKVKVALLDEAGAQAAAQAPKVAAPAKPRKQPMKGIGVAPLTAPLRAAYHIAPELEGVVVTEAAGGDGRGLKAGDVILEAAQQKVRSPEEFRARLASLRALSWKDALLTVATPDGEISFVDVALD
jgi:serine protease Do